MVEVKIKSIWNGMVGLNEKYYAEAIHKGVGLALFCGNEMMLIPAESVHSFFTKSKEPFKDKFTNAKYHLIYYKWRPEKAETNQSLF